MSPEEEKKYKKLNSWEQVQYDFEKKKEYLKATAAFHILSLIEYIENIDKIRSYELEKRYPNESKYIAIFEGKNFY